jgi:hypothetical protein
METRFPYDRESQQRIVADRVQERLAPAEAARRRYPCPEPEPADPVARPMFAPAPVRRRWLQVRLAFRSKPCPDQSQST